MSDRQDSVHTDSERSAAVVPNRDVAALFSNLHLNPAQYQPFTRRKTGKAPERSLEVRNHGPVDRACMHIGIFSPMGGSGMSTLTAALGSILCQLGLRVLLVDTSPWQALAFHFGASEARSGKRTFCAPGSRELKIHILACDESVSGFPDLESFVVTTPVDCVLFDLGGLAGGTLNVCLRECNALLVPLLPDPSAVRLANAVMVLLGKLGSSAPRARFVLNQMDDSPDSNKVQTLLSRALGENLFPSAIRRQAEIDNAIANGVVLPFYAPEAQATAVCQQIVEWLQISEMNTTKSELRWSEE